MSVALIDQILDLLWERNADVNDQYSQYPPPHPMTRSLCYDSEAKQYFITDGKIMLAGRQLLELLPDYCKKDVYMGDGKIYRVMPKGELEPIDDLFKNYAIALDYLGIMYAINSKKILHAKDDSFSSIFCAGSISGIDVDCIVMPIVSNEDFHNWKAKVMK